MVAGGEAMTSSPLKVTRASREGAPRPATTIWYVHPMFKHVSFAVFGEKHYKLLRRYFRVEPVDELAFPFIGITSRPLVMMQPYFYPMQKFERKIARNLGRISGIIGVDVADSDHLSEYAVRLTEHATAMIVPSEFARRSYIRSEVRRPVHVVPHGVDEEWIDAPRQEPTTFHHLARLKERRKLKLILCWILHSPIRKGLDLLLQYYQQLMREYNDVLLVVKTAKGVGYFLETVEKVGGELEYYMDGKTIIGWLNEREKMELYDICDLYFLSSRGGAFEHPSLEALARGEIVLGAKGGAWEDFLPKWALIPSRRSGQVLPGNPIHDGCGVEVLIDKAVDKTLEIFDNMDEYRARVREHIETCIRRNFTWEVIGERLRDVVGRYL